MKMKRLLVLLMAWMLFGTLNARQAAAQTDSGQFWVKLYEDRDGDGVQDEGEPPITRGVAVNLLDAENIVIASSALEASPYAARGEVGFQYLAAGDYTLQVSASEWMPTTPTTFTQTIRADDVPTVVNVGVQRIVGVLSGADFTPAELEVRSSRAQIALAGLGAALVGGGMFAFGLIIIAMMERRRR